MGKKQKKNVKTTSEEVYSMFDEVDKLTFEIEEENVVAEGEDEGTS